MDILTLWLAGDVMTGRGIDQIQAHPSAPRLYESLVHDARDYVQLAEEVNGRIVTPVAPDYIWGDALAEIERRKPHARLANLETAVTSASEPWPHKGVNYRMHPANIGCLSAARLDCCTLANNHVLDWGPAGLAETLHTLQQAGIRTAGAGSTSETATLPAVLPLPNGARLLVFAWASSDSGVLLEWGATPRRAGIALLSGLTDAAAREVAEQVERHRQPGDRVVISLHWGGNWGAEVPPLHRQFAHRLIELSAADLVHGHSSHHPRPVEVYRSKLILYGCGDLINDYEGIGIHGHLAPSAVCLYFAQLSPGSGDLLQLEMVPMQLRRLHLVHANAQARRSLQSLFDTQGQPLHTSLQRQADGSWQLQW